MKNSINTGNTTFVKRGFRTGLILLSVAASQLLGEEAFPLDTSPVDEGAGLRITSYADVLDPARSAVVSVTTASIVETMRGGGRDPMEEFLRRYYGIPSDPRRQQPEGERFEQRVPNGLGSGVIISEDGYILTNNHVISDNAGEPADEITVHLDDGREVEAVLVGRDERTDVALLKIEASGLPFITMADSNQLRVGDIVFAIGNPLGVGQTSTMGIVSATGRTNLGLLGNQGYENFIQTDAAINRGNSGGALVDAKGRLIGVNTAIFSQTGGNIGIGFAIPSKLVRTVIHELIDSGRVRRGYLGVSISDLNPDMAEAFGLDSTNGALIESVQDGAPADQAGILRGDIVTEIEDSVVESVADLRLKVASLRPGTDVEVTLLRDGERESVVITLGSLDDPVVSRTDEDSPLEGVGLESLNPELRSEWKLEEESGVIVTEIDPRSPYAPILALGMVILEVNDTEVMTIGQIADSLLVDRVNKLWVSYRGNRGYLALRVE